MRFILNFFLILFILDGTISVIDSLNGTTGFELLKGIRLAVAAVAIIAAFLLFIMTAFDRRIPKRLFFPPLFFLFWFLAGAQPVTTLFSSTDSDIILSTIQLLLGLSIICAIRMMTGSWLFPSDYFKEYSFSLKYSAIFLITAFISLPAILVVYAAYSLQFYVFHKTSGFIRLSTDGIYMKEKIYTRDDKTIRLIGMIHIGEEDYYRKLENDLTQPDTILLAEGVTDRKKLLTNRFSTKMFAEKWFLSSQEDMELQGRFIDSMTFYGQTSEPGGSDEPVILNADVDVSAFSEGTIKFLNAMGKHFMNAESPAEGLSAYNIWAEEKMSSELVDSIIYDILGHRNEVVIRYMKKAAEKYDTIVVPWGALHMPEIEKAVCEMGFHPLSSNERLSIKFDMKKIKKGIENFIGRFDQKRPEALLTKPAAII